MFRTPPAGQARRPTIAIVIPLLVLALGLEARADLINLTGNVAHDFTPLATTATIPGRPGSVAEAPYIIQNGWTTGFLVESIKLAYDRPSDTMFVGVQTFSITGDADGNGDPGFTDRQMAAAGGINYAHFGGDKSLTVAFANSTPDGGLGSPGFVAGIPGDKSTGDSRNTNDFTVATYNDTGRGLAYSYGTTLNGHVGQLAVDPSASMPNFEFALTNFSKITGFNAFRPFYLSLFLGSQRAIVVGKEQIDWTKIPGINPAPEGINSNHAPITPPGPAPAVIRPTAVPEPASVVLLAIGVIGLVGTSWSRGFGPHVSGSAGGLDGSGEPRAMA
jgi:hypothetical protein